MTFGGFCGIFKKKYALEGFTVKKMLLFCIIMLQLSLFSGCNSSPFTSLYDEVGLYFIQGIGSITESEAEAFAKISGYDMMVDSFTNELTVYDVQNNAVDIVFENDIVVGVEYRDYKKQISFSLESGRFKIVDLSAEVVKEVSSLAECETYLFGRDSGVTVPGVFTSYTTASTTISGSNIQMDNADSIKYFSLCYGELKDIKETEGIIVIKAKIDPSYSNNSTINQNYYNIEDIIKNQGGNGFNEIQYWAVADMTDGSESKVISFTLSSDVIQKIADGEIAANSIGNYADDLFIHQSLR